jgi:hypothetical protein
MPISAKHAEALAYARDGIPVFPCFPDSKRPACANGFHDATCEEATVNAWFEEADYNLALCPNDAGWCVIDVDPGGLEAWENLCREHGQQKTPRVRTPRGGWHIYYRGSLPPTASRLARGIDTRGVGSYVLVPPSSVNGVSYEWQDECEMQEVPEWIAEACIAKTESANAAVEELDTPAALARARSVLTDYAHRGDIAREGEGGDNRTYILAAEILALGCSPEQALDLIDEIWNPHCIPPWSREELAVKIDNAARYMQNEAGAYNVETAREAFGSTLDKLIETDKAPAPSHSRFRPLALEELVSELREPAWIIPELIPERSTVQVLGKQKSFKTFLTLDLALGIASGRETFGHRPVECPVVYAVGENASAFGLRHIPAWRIARDTPESFPFYTVPAVPRAIFPDECKELIAEIQKRGIAPGVVVIDTATRALRGLDENSAKDMGMFSECCDFIKKELNCTVIAIRHTGKDQARGGRGSNVIEGDFDTLIEVERHEKSMAVAVTVKDQRNAQEREKPYTFEGRPIGQSLVFFPTSEAQHSQLTRTEHVYTRKTIGKALSSLGAFGREHAVPTPVVAAEILPSHAGETPQERQEALGRACKELNRLACTVFLAYCEAIGRDRVWYLPADAG